MSKVLVIGTSRDTHGGITSVLSNHEKTFAWQKFGCEWIEAQTNVASKIGKIKCLIKAYIECFYKIPKSNLIHFHSVPGNCNKIQLPMFLWAKLWRIPIVTHLHVGNQIINYKDNKLFRYVLKSSDQVVTLAYKWKDVIDKMYDLKSPALVIYNPAPENRIRCVQRKKYFLFAAYLDKNKGCDIVLEAFSHIAKEFPEWKLIMAGSGPEEKNIKQFIRTHHLENQVEMPGWISGDAKEKLFGEASAFCLASFMEGFPMSVLDAWSMATPVIATPVGGLPDVAKDGENILLFDFGNSEGLEKKMRRFIDDKMFKKLSDASTNLAQTTFSINTLSGKLDSLYKLLLKN